MRSSIERRLAFLEDGTTFVNVHLDLQERLSRYEKIFEALDSGKKLDQGDPLVRQALEHQKYFNCFGARHEA